jgi:tetratricopeptide (TPR) repeat protein
MNRARPWWLLLLFVSRVAWATPSGSQLYENGEYEAAVQSFEQLLATPQASSSERGEARLYLAASLYALGRMEEARRQLTVLAREHPDQRVDAVRFVPELVALAEVIRQQVESERNFEARRLELEHKAQEERLRRPPPPAISLRPELIGLVEALDRGWTVGLGAGVQLKSLEGSVRVLLGAPAVIHLQGGMLFGDSSVWKPFVGLRASLLPVIDSYGGGPVVGARFMLPKGFVALAEVGADYFFIGREDRLPWALTAQVGLAFDVRLQ